MYALYVLQTQHIEMDSIKFTDGHDFKILITEHEDSYI